MSESLVDTIARAVLYEGYILYPYRPSVKSHQRWTFGGVFPQAFSEAHPGSDASCMQTEVLVVCTDFSKLSLGLRFLHLVERTIEQAPTFERVASLRMGGKDYQSWQEATEREVRFELSLAELLHDARSYPFAFPASRDVELIYDGDRLVARLVREQKAVVGVIGLSAQRLGAHLLKVTARVVNETPTDVAWGRQDALLCAFASTHMILGARDGSFISCTDPTPEVRDFAAGCQQMGCWPVLVGEANQTDTMLVSPIILPDYPQVAPESPGDLFDGTEIDEILTLRIMTLTDEEKRLAAGTDERVRRMLARTEGLAREQLMNLHGTVRSMGRVDKESAHG